MPKEEFNYTNAVELSGDEARLLIDVSYHLGDNVYITKGSSGYHTFRISEDPYEDTDIDIN